MNDEIQLQQPERDEAAELASIDAYFRAKQAELDGGTSASLAAASVELATFD